MSDFQVPLEVVGQSGGSEAGVSYEANRSEPLSILMLDFGLVAVSIPVLLPTIGLLWLLVKSTSPKHGAFFRQVRYGLDGKPFEMVKFRSMVPDAEAMKESLLHLSEDKGPGFKVKNDPRITKLGRFLRKTHLDEVPQFINVLRGEMSIVGPRANSYHPSNYEPWQLERLSVKPGITGSWQIAKIKPQDFSERCKMDIEYIAERSFWVNLKIILTTSFVVFRAPGD